MELVRARSKIHFRIPFFPSGWTPKIKQLIKPRKSCMADRAKTISKEGIVVCKYFTSTEIIAKKSEDKLSNITPFVSFCRAVTSALNDQSDSDCRLFCELVIVLPAWYCSCDKSGVDSLTIITLEGIGFTVDSSSEGMY